MQDIQSQILHLLPIDGWVDYNQLHLDVAFAIRAPVQPEDFEQAIADLADMLELAREGDRVSRREPDFRERDLEEPVGEYLFSASCFARLRIQRENSVSRVTARGGRVGMGQWSRPDFTVAAVNRWLFDPRRTLEVYAFELKNRAGSTLTAVHEALAHTRFAHYAYVVCPRSQLKHERVEYLLNECANHGIGLITFTLGVRPEPGGIQPLVGEFEEALNAVRKTPDPHDVQQYLLDRFPDSARRDLQSVAGTL